MLQTTNLLNKLRREAMQRCAERIRSSKDKSKNHECDSEDTQGLTSSTKAKHGL